MTKRSNMMVCTAGVMLIASGVARAQLFEGRVLTEWSADANGREMTLVEDFAFVDENGIRWEAPARSVIDGASIPRVFWSRFGPPFVGQYRRGSVIHDVYCETKSAPHREVHRMFFDAIRADGVGFARARLMYAAVAVFGPKWEIIETMGLEGPERRVVNIDSDPAIEFDELVRQIEEQDLSIDQIDELSEGL